MFGAISGAMHGREAIPRDWVEVIERESKRDFQKSGTKMAEIAKEIFDRDAERNARIKQSRETLFSKPVLSRIK